MAARLAQSLLNRLAGDALSVDFATSQSATESPVRATPPGAAKLEIMLWVLPKPYPGSRVIRDRPTHLSISAWSPSDKNCLSPGDWIGIEAPFACFSGLPCMHEVHAATGMVSMVSKAPGEPRHECR